MKIVSFNIPSCIISCLLYLTFKFNFEQFSVLVILGSGSQREDVESNNTVTPILADYLDYTVDDLRALVVSAVKSGKLIIKKYKIYALF